MSDLVKQLKEKISGSKVYVDAAKEAVKTAAHGLVDGTLMSYFVDKIPFAPRPVTPTTIAGIMAGRCATTLCDKDQPTGKKLINFGIPTAVVLGKLFEYMHTGNWMDGIDIIYGALMGLASGGLERKLLRGEVKVKVPRKKKEPTQA